MSRVTVGKIDTLYEHGRSSYENTWEVAVDKTGYIHLDTKNGLRYLSPEEARIVAALLTAAADQSADIVDAFADNERLDAEVAKAKADRLAAFQTGRFCV